ncbi:MAG: hypothetical protein KAG89_07900 [Fulvimarina manganoxydans]|uniref:hypothetical protein n=1 Tax=Fulvimarina manganoxydans TaxID=937218 RepID=UPI002356D5BE|nr:hypothetical protein [Fulvimarina manganoxydans]MCK5932082.1 hypothetical protein [Fulvimarina manganoxydans]
MKILAVRPAPRSASGRVLAFFDVEIGEHLRLYNLALRRTPDGRLRTVAPRTDGKHCATFHPDLANDISAAANVALGGRAANADR